MFSPWNFTKLLPLDAIFFFLQKLPAMQPLLKKYKSTTECLSELRNGKVRALIVKETTALYQTYTPPCTEILVGERFAHGFTSIGLPKNSPYVGLLNSIIIAQVESGELEDFDSRWLVDQCQMGALEESLTNDVITPFQVRGIFYILLMAIFLAFVGLLYQVISSPTASGLLSRHVLHQAQASSFCADQEYTL